MGSQRVRQPSDFHAHLWYVLLQQPTARIPWLHYSLWDATARETPAALGSGGPSSRLHPAATPQLDLRAPSVLVSETEHFNLSEQRVLFQA